MEKAPGTMLILAVADDGKTGGRRDRENFGFAIQLMPEVTFYNYTGICVSRCGSGLKQWNEGYVTMF